MLNPILKSNLKNCKRILLTPGEPAGIGPDIILHIAQYPWPVELIVIADPDLLLTRSTILKIPVKLVKTDLSQQRKIHQANQIYVLPTSLNSPVTPGQLNKINATYVLTTLEKATSLCLEGQADAVVTGPVQKSVINEAGFAFTGHTEFFAERCGHKDTLMLFVVDKLKVALLTTHLPLKKVSEAITREKLYASITLFHKELTNKFFIPNPRILICGLNPHAGEAGNLGREEIDIMEPIIKQLESEGMNIKGPLPADTLFTPKYLQQADAVLSMYHDQALPLVKYLGFGKAVNVTLGLPFVRTSVDHGTALDVAGSGQADPGSLMEALKLAIEMSEVR